MDATTGSAALRGAVKAAGLLKQPPGAGPKLGSRQERRTVYALFITATFGGVALLQHAEFQQVRYPRFMRARAIDKLEDLQRATAVDLMQAYAEVRLVANPAPLAAAATVMDCLNLAFQSLGSGQAVTEAAVEQLTTALDAFILASRADLWYQHRWWQVWRGAWWKAKRKPKPIRLGVEPPQ